MSKPVNWFFLTIIYAGWALTTWFHDDLPLWLLLPVGAWLLAWYGSFQHEAVHGHLASRRWLNDLLIYLPLYLWLPFPIYRHSHRAHHHFDILTDPYRDPESFYIDRTAWAALPRSAQYLLIWHNTLLGRLALGPLLTIGQFYYAEARALLSGDFQHLKAWLWHLVCVAIVLIWVVVICAMPLWAYLLWFVLPGTSLMLVRSFAEHKAANTSWERTAIVESGPLFSLLFLNNNLHFAHHRRPDLPWQDLPSYYRTHRQDLLKDNSGLCYRGGYWEIARRFLTRPIDRPAHPLT
jgi:fatty acid desaturase